jgi:hypothetical protein
MGNMMGVPSLKVIESLTSLLERQLCAKSKLLRLVVRRRKTVI